MPRDVVMWSENPTLHVDNELKHGDISDASIWRTWEVRYFDANLEFTHPHHSFTSSAYHVLEVSITIERKPGFALQTTTPLAKCLLLILWFTALVTDVGTSILIAALVVLALIFVFKATDRPAVPYITLIDKRFAHLLTWGVYPMLGLLSLFAVVEKVFEFSPAFERDFRNFLIYGRMASILVAFMGYKLGDCVWGCEISNARERNEYMLNIQKQSSLSATIKEPDLPPDMSIFTLWESKQFLGRKNTPLPESVVYAAKQREAARRRPKSASAAGRRPSASGPQYSVYAKTGTAQPHDDNAMSGNESSSGGGGYGSPAVGGTESDDDGERDGGSVSAGNFKFGGGSRRGMLNEGGIGGGGSRPSSPGKKSKATKLAEQEAELERWRKARKEGKEQWKPAGKHVYFEDKGNFQDNELRDKQRGSTKGILMQPTIGAFMRNKS